MSEREHKPSWRSPLPGCDWSMPIGKGHPAGFGAKRPYSLHTGVDLYCEDGQPVVAVESGTVVAINDFSRRKNKSPGINHTRVILIEGETGVCVYGNVKEKKGLKVGQHVKAGQHIGKVRRINRFRKRDKEDICMLHFELYEHGTRKRVVWSYNFPKPPQLLDPSSHLISIITETQVTYRRRRNP